MDALALPTISTASAAGGALNPALAPAAGEGVRGADFADLLSQMMQAGQRQDLAAPSLQSLAISPNIEVITADEPLPDSDSLLAFARGQGLDESMLRSLFPGAAPAAANLGAQAGVGVPSAVVVAASAGLFPAGAPVPAPPLVSSVSSPAQTQSAAGDTSPAASGPSAPGVATAPPWPVYLGVPVATQPPAALSEPSSGISVAGVQVQSLVVTQAPTLLASTVPAAAGVPMAGVALPAAAVAVHAPVGAAVSAPMAASSSDEAAPGALLVAAAQAQATVRAQPERLPAASDALSVDEAQATDPEHVAARASEPLTAAQGARQLQQEALRLRLQSQHWVTQRLAGLAASGGQATWGQLTAQPADELLSLALSPDEAVTLDAPESPPWSHGLQHAPAGGTGASRDVLMPADAVASTADDRLFQYEQLAQRLGQALAQRLQSQIERGQWKVQMQVDPVSLGRIEMELEMRGGGLEAVFRSDNQMTRDLIAQGLPRLRESLNQSGTAVANFWVQGDSSRQSGGNPTPGRWAQPAPGRISGERESEPVEAVCMSRPRTDGSAWDVLA